MAGTCQPGRQLPASAAGFYGGRSFADGDNFREGLWSVLARAVVIAANENFLINRVALLDGAGHGWLGRRRALQLGDCFTQYGQFFASFGGEHLLFLLFRNSKRPGAEIDVEEEWVASSVEFRLLGRRHIFLREHLPNPIAIRAHGFLPFGCARLEACLIRQGNSGKLAGGRGSPFIQVGARFGSRLQIGSPLLQNIFREILVSARIRERSAILINAPPGYHIVRQSLTNLPV